MGGNFAIGDLIVTSSLPGYGMRQDNGIVQNITAGKITCSVDWTDPNLGNMFDTRVVDGHMCAFVGCVYMCG